MFKKCFVIEKVLLKIGFLNNAEHYYVKQVINRFGGGENNKAIKEVCRIFVEKGKQDPNWVGLNTCFSGSEVELNEMINPWR